MYVYMCMYKHIETYIFIWKHIYRDSERRRERCYVSFVERDCLPCFPLQGQNLAWCLEHRVCIESTKSIAYINE